MTSPTVQHVVIEAQDYITVKLKGLLIPESIPAFQNDFPLIVKSTHHVVVQCTNLSGLTVHWLRALLALERGLRDLNRKLIFIDVQEKLVCFFKEQGVDSALVLKANLREALVKMGLATKKIIDTDFINPFLAATMRVLEIQCKTKASPGKIFIKKDSDKLSGDISGVIGLVSESFNGSVFISFPEQTFLEVMGRMFGEKLDKLTKEIEDGAAELTNIIFGQAKIILNDKGYGIKTALPSVISGKDHSVTSSAKSLTVIVPFDSDAGNFYVEISTSI